MCFVFIEQLQYGVLEAPSAFLHGNMRQSQQHLRLIVSLIYSYLRACLAPPLPLMACLGDVPCVVGSKQFMLF